MNSKYGNELRFISIHRFTPDDLEVINFVPDLKNEAGNILIKKYIYEWFREAETRGDLDKLGQETYLLNEQGLAKIRVYKSPIKAFFQEHWKWLVTASMAFGGMVIAIIRLTE